MALRPLKLAWYWLLAFKLAVDELLFGRPTAAAAKWHRELHADLFGEAG